MASSGEGLNEQAEWEFGGFRLLPEAGVLLQGDRVVRIGSRAFALLKILVERAGETVTREELMARAWPATAVVEDNLKVQMSALRRLLGGDKMGAQIVAVPGQGYRFMGMVASRVAPLASSRLPRVTTRLFGREDSLAATVARLRTERLVTIVGAAGIGKSMLATAAARADGILDSVFVDLSTLTDASVLAALVAGALGFPVTSADARPTLISHFGKHPMLLVLDNCEHLLESATLLVAELLEATDDLRVLATSREPLRLAGEWVFRLAPLGTPNGPIQDEAEAAQYPAVELFVDRVTAQADGFQFAPEDWSTVAEVCRRLDGIPLAIELAAAAASNLGIADLSANLQQSLEAAVPPRGGPVRHATLHAALDWSYRLLSEGERRMLRRLAVFNGAFTLAAATEVAGGAEIEPDPLQVFIALADKSFVNVHMSGGEVRYRLLEMTRAFGLARMDALEARATRRRHAEHQLRRLAEEEGRHDQPERAAAIAVYAGMIDDIRAALDWALGPEGDVALAARLMVDSTVAWYQLSLSWEGRERADRVLARVGELNDPHADLRVRGARCIGMNYSVGVASPTAAAFGELSAQAQALQDPTYEIMGHWGLFGADMYLGRFREGLRRAEACGDLARLTGRPSDLALATYMRVQPAASLGRLAAARADADHALRLFEAPGGSGGLVRYQFEPRLVVRTLRSRILWLQGFADQALAEARACAGQAERSGQALTISYGLLDAAAQTAVLTGALDEADRLLAAHRRLIEDFAMGRRSLAANLGLRAAVAAARGTGVAAQDGLLAALKADPDNRFPLRFPALVGPMAQALAESGRPLEAMVILEEMLGGLVHDPEHWGRAELLRARAQVRLSLDGDAARPAAEADLEASVALAAAQGARTGALRAATDLAHLPAPSEVRRARAARLKALMQNFTEGFATADYRRAVAVLGKDPIASDGS